MKIKCENPTLIFNPNLVWLFSCKCERAILNNVSFDCHSIHGNFYNFPWKAFYAARNEVTPETADQYMLVDSDGIVYPVFMYVPCGKCRLCRAKKTEEWETRCMCESATTPYRPLFITLTYKPECRPVDMYDIPGIGLMSYEDASKFINPILLADYRVSAMETCYQDFQKFMKRLRINVERDYGIKSELRYIAVSEFTPTNHYPHIHMILWRMPFIPAAEGDKNSYQTLIRYIQDDCWQNGYCKVEFARDPSCAYPLKYMRKGMDPECWYHSSRRPGIGYDFCMSLLSTVLENADMSVISIPVTKFNRRTGEETRSIVQRPFPSYFKRLLFPTLSVLFPNHITQACKDFMLLATKLQTIFNWLLPDCRCFHKLCNMVHAVSEKYSLMHIDFKDGIVERNFEDKVVAWYFYNDASDRFVSKKDDRLIRPVYKWTVVNESLRIQNKKISKYTYRSRYDHDIDSPICRYHEYDNTVHLNDRQFALRAWHQVCEYYKLLMSFDFNESEFLKRLSVTTSHQEYIRAMMELAPEVDIQEAVDVYERDLRWVETHWLCKEIG